MNLAHPADALSEYVRLTGQAAMPPKWVMGYMQSHRSLASAQEVLQVAKLFRDDQLPCDALIYLGSGYTNDQDGQSGWNTGHGSLTFNPRIFDKPKEMIDALHELHFKIILHENAAPAGCSARRSIKPAPTRFTSAITGRNTCRWLKWASTPGGRMTVTNCQSKTASLVCDCIIKAR